MDLSAEYYLQTVETVFVRHDLPNGTMTHRGVPVDPARIRRVALLTVEGENDDISGLGQTEAAHRLCVNIPADRKSHWMQPGVGHYGVFNGSRYRAEIAPRIADFVLSNNGEDGHGGKRAAKNESLAAAKPNIATRASATATSASAAATKVPAATE
jgi:poly(3-hydroxybutyrate) depolymerase